MKRIVFCFLLCFTIMFTAACNNAATDSAPARFESDQQMHSFLEGMWVTEEKTHTEYYIFQGSYLYLLTDESYSYGVQQILESAVINGGLKAWPLQTFENVSPRLRLDDVAVSTRVKYDPKAGQIILNEGAAAESQITISGDTVQLSGKLLAGSFPLVKLSDTLDLTGAHFQELFSQVQKNCTISKEAFLPSVAEYEQFLRQSGKGSRLDDFQLADKTNNTSIYTFDGTLNSVEYGYLMLNPNELYYTDGNFIDGKTAIFAISYNPSGNGTVLIVTSSVYSRVSSLLGYAVPVLQNVPTALSASELLTLYEKEQTVSGDCCALVKTVNGIRYEIMQTSGGQNSHIIISIPDKLPLPAVEEPEPRPSSGITGLDQLDSSKVWTISCEIDDTTYADNYVLMEDGSCYVAYGFELEVYDGGIGTYRIDGNTIYFDITVGETQLSYGYAYNPKTDVLVHTYGTPVFEADYYTLTKNTDISVEKVIELVQMFSSNSPADDGDEEYDEDDDDYIDPDEL